MRWKESRVERKEGSERTEVRKVIEPVTGPIFSTGTPRRPDRGRVMG